MCRQFDPAPRHHILKHSTSVGCFLLCVIKIMPSKDVFSTPIGIF
ncbi:hypothetical protein [Moraxella lacunata]